MNNLIKFKSSLLIQFLFVVFVFGSLLISTTLIRVDKTKTVKLTCLANSEPKLIAEPNEINDINFSEGLVIRRDDEYFRINIEKIAFNTDTGLTELYLDRKPFFMLPGSQVSAKVVTGSQTLLDSLLK